MNLTENKFYQIKKGFSYISICFFIVSLAGCVNDDYQDLKQYIKMVKGTPKGNIQPLPEIKVIEPFIFDPEGLRNPFQAIKKNRKNGNDIKFLETGIRPDLSRRKEELEAYSLDTLRMVGILMMDSELWALIKGKEGTIHRVKKGNYMGRNNGQIIRILDDKVELMEIVPKQPGVWREKKASLALVE